MSKSIKPITFASFIASSLAQRHTIQTFVHCRYINYTSPLCLYSANSAHSKPCEQHSQRLTAVLHRTLSPLQPVSVSTDNGGVGIIFSSPAGSSSHFFSIFTNDYTIIFHSWMHCFHNRNL